MEIKNLYVMSDTHDDVEAVNAAVDFAASQGLKNSRLVHCGDFSLRPYSLEDLRALARTRDVNAFKTAKKRTNNQTLNEMKRIFDTSEIPYTVVPGNYDGDLDDIFGEANIHLRTAQFGNLRVAGYGGADANPPHIELLEEMGEITRFDHGELYRHLMKTNPTIAIIHNPPQGLCDDMYNGKNAGTPATTKYIVENGGIKLVLSGHIHEAGPNANNPDGIFGLAQAKRSQNGEVITVINPGNLGRFELIHPRTLDTIRTFDYGTFVRVDVKDDGTPAHLTQYTVQKEGRRIGDVREIRSMNLCNANDTQKIID